MQADGLRWRVVEMGKGEAIFLVHGTAASVHSWRDVMPLLANSYRVIAVDLPGHGETEALSSRDYTLERMARGVAAVFKAMALVPKIAAGHSAGAAILAEVCVKHQSIDALVSFNGAFYPFGGPAAGLFSPLAKLIAANPLMPHLVSAFISRDRVKKLLQDTGSTLTAEGVEAYWQLLKTPRHIAGALGMMAAWDLSRMDQTLAAIKGRALFVAGSNDKAIPPGTADRAAAQCHSAKALHVAGLGHLLHEEDPALAARIISGMEA